MTPTIGRNDTTLGSMVPRLPDSPHQRIASHGLLLRVLVGSGVHGTAVDGQDDRDEMGVCLEPVDTVLGFDRFDHYEYRTQPQGVRSGPGDLDLIVYSLRKYLRLVTSGNPTTLLPLFVPEEHVCHLTGTAMHLRDNAYRLVSRRAAPRFLGYLNAQRTKLQSGGATSAGRADIIARYGYDTKFAMHMVRLGFQGIELLSTGGITLPMPGAELQVCRAIRNGELTMTAALALAADLEAQLVALRSTSPLPEQPDYAWATQFCLDAHLDYWAETL